MMISSNRKGVRSRSARMTARALSHRPQVRREYMTTATSPHPCGVCEDCPDRPLTAHPFRSSGTQDRMARDSEDQRDDELHRRLALGDRDAFEQLYRRYAPAASGLAYRVTGQELLAQDVVHDSFLALWKAPEAFDPARGSFRTFFLSLVHHRAVDTVRREERLRRRTERAANLESPADEDVAEDIVEQAWLAMRRKEVHEALRALPPDQRRVLEMAYFHGYTQADIAEELEIPLGTVKTRTLAAMQKLRRLLGN